MQVTVISLDDGELEAHRSGCEHLRTVDLRYGSATVCECSSRQDVAKECFSELVPDVLSASDAVRITNFAPCLSTLA